MNILTNKNIRNLFCRVMLLIAGFALLSIVFSYMYPEHAPLFILFFSFCTGGSSAAVLYLYFRKQHRIMEQAVLQIRDYLSGNREARIPCDEEGELYRLFHEINALAAVLNAHAEHEAHAKDFVKDTVSDISHQLKTPLAALNIYNGILQEETKDLPAAREFAGLSEMELDRIETLVQNLLKITKFDAGTVVLKKKPETISEMMETVERQFAYRAEQEEKELSFSGGSTIMLSCDRVWLMEAIGNLVKNALDHTKKGDVIQVSWKQFASIIQITVKDTGSGIHPEDLHHIFKRFYRSRFSQDTQGIGLGLSLAKAVVEAHNGTIEVDSSPGSGTTFTVNFLIPSKL